MLIVSNEYANGILADSRDMPYRVSIGGTMLDQTNVPKMELTESIGGNSGIALGTANAAELTLHLREPMLSNYDGMLVEPESGLVLADGSIEWVPLGKFWVTKTATNNDYRTVTLTCSDGMCKLTGDYISELKYPASIKAVVNEVMSQAGVDFVEPDTWPDLIVRVKPEKMSLRNAVGHLAGCFGCNARFNRAGQLEFVWYNDTGITIERETQYLDGMTKLHDKPLDVSFEITGEKEKYECIIECGENGSATATPANNILEGDTVTVAVRPDDKYMLATITAKDAQGAAVVLVADAEGAGYTFVQPDSNVTVMIAFKLSNEGPFQLTCRSSGNGGLSFDPSPEYYKEGLNYFAKDEEVHLIVSPGSGFTLDGFSTIPGSINITETGVDVDGSPVYMFVMPDCDVTVTAHFREETSYNIERVIWDIDGTRSPGVILVTNETAGGYVYHEGDIITVSPWASVGYEVDHCDSNVEMTQIDATTFRFTMPAHDVTFNAYFKEQSDPTKEGIYSFLQHPSLAQPPAGKPHWAVFYKYSQSVTPNAKYYLVWFDSWSESYGTITMNGYYYCQGRNSGNANHKWDTSVWSGNGSEGSTLKWESVYGVRNEDDYGLLACSTNLYRGTELIFQKCDTAIGTSQCDWYLTGTDIREAGALDHYPCPDTYSTPLPGANWVVLDYLDMRQPNEESWSGYDTVYDSYSTCAVFFNSVSISRVGTIYSNTDEEFFLLTFNGGATIVPLYADGDFSAYPKTVEGTCYVYVRDPDIGSSGSNSHSGLLAASCDLLSGGLGFYNNKHIICDCVHVASTFKMRRGVASDPVTLTYTNPLIYEKMVPAISDVVQGISYTPAKVKHRGMPNLQTGDIVTVPDGDGVYHTVLIQQQTMTFGGGMNSEVSCPGQTSETASYTNGNPVTMQIKEEVNKSYSQMSHDLDTRNAASFSAIYRAMDSMKNTLNSIIASMGDDVYAANEDINGIDVRLSLMEGDLADLAGKTLDYEVDLSYLESDIADLQAKISILEKEMSNVQIELDDTQLSFDEVHAKLAELEEMIVNFTPDDEALNQLGTRVTAVEKSVSELKTKVSDVQTAIKNETTAREAAIAAVRQVPEGGEAGQVLTQTEDGTPEWQTIKEKKTIGLNFSEWDNGQFSEVVDGDEAEHVYTVEFDEQGRPIKITDEGGQELSITW